MKKVYYYVSMGFNRITPFVLLTKMRNMVVKMTANANFATPVPPLATVTAACDTLETTIQAYQLNPGPLEHSERAQAFEVVKGLGIDLGSYVQAASNGDLAKIESAGCEVRRSSTPIGQLPAPPNVVATGTAYTGQIIIRFGGVKGRSGYNVFICSGDPNVEANWRMLDFTSKNRYVANGLPSDVVHYFRVNAIGAAGASPMSDVTSAKAA